MRVFVLVALSMGSLLATASASAHTQPLRKPAPELVAVTAHVDSVAFTGPAVSSHPTVSVRPRFGGFRGTPSFHTAPAYRSFSPAPSRTFTFSTRPAATYSRPASTSPVVRVAPSYVHPAPIVNHYHSASTGSGSGGMSVGEALLLHQALSSSNASSLASNSSPPATGRQLSQSSQAGDDERWAVAPLIGLGLVLIVGGGLLLHFATRKEEPVKRSGGGYTPFS